MAPPPGVRIPTIEELRAQAEAIPSEFSPEQELASLQPGEAGPAPFGIGATEALQPTPQGVVPTRDDIIRMLSESEAQDPENFDPADPQPDSPFEPTTLQKLNAIEPQMRTDISRSNVGMQEVQARGELAKHQVLGRIQKAGAGPNLQEALIDPERSTLGPLAAAVVDGLTGESSFLWERLPKNQRPFVASFLDLFPNIAAGSLKTITQAFEKAAFGEVSPDPAFSRRLDTDAEGATTLPKMPPKPSTALQSLQRDFQGFRLRSPMDEKGDLEVGTFLAAYAGNIGKAANDADIRLDDMMVSQAAMMDRIAVGAGMPKGSGKFLMSVLLGIPNGLHLDFMQSFVMDSSAEFQMAYNHMFNKKGIKAAGISAGRLRRPMDRPFAMGEDGKLNPKNFGHRPSIMERALSVVLPSDIDNLDETMKTGLKVLTEGQFRLSGFIGEVALPPFGGLTKFADPLETAARKIGMVDELLDTVTSGMDALTKPMRLRLFESFQATADNHLALQAYDAAKSGDIRALDDAEWFMRQTQIWYETNAEAFNLSKRLADEGLGLGPFPNSRRAIRSVMDMGNTKAGAKDLIAEGTKANTIKAKVRRFREGTTLRPDHATKAQDPAFAAYRRYAETMRTIADTELGKSLQTFGQIHATSAMAVDHGGDLVMSPQVLNYQRLEELVSQARQSGTTVRNWEELTERIFQGRKPKYFQYTEKLPDGRLIKHQPDKVFDSLVDWIGKNEKRPLRERQMVSEHEVAGFFNQPPTRTLKKTPQPDGTTQIQLVPFAGTGKSTPPPEHLGEIFPTGLSDALIKLRNSEVMSEGEGELVRNFTNMLLRQEEPAIMSFRRLGIQGIEGDVKLAKGEGTAEFYNTMVNLETEFGKEMSTFKEARMLLSGRGKLTPDTITPQSKYVRPKDMEAWADEIGLPPSLVEEVFDIANGQRAFSLEEGAALAKAQGLVPLTGKAAKQLGQHGPVYVEPRVAEFIDRLGVAQTNPNKMLGLIRKAHKTLKLTMTWANPGAWDFGVMWDDRLRMGVMHGWDVAMDVPSTTKAWDLMRGITRNSKDESLLKLIKELGIDDLSTIDRTGIVEESLRAPGGKVTEALTRMHKSRIQMQATSRVSLFLQMLDKGDHPALAAAKTRITLGSFRAATQLVDDLDPFWIFARFQSHNVMWTYRAMTQNPERMLQLGRAMGLGDKDHNRENFPEYLQHKGLTTLREGVEAAVSLPGSMNHTKDIALVAGFITPFDGMLSGKAFADDVLGGDVGAAVSRLLGSASPIWGAIADLGTARGDDAEGWAVIKRTVERLPPVSKGVMPLLSVLEAIPEHMYQHAPPDVQRAIMTTAALYGVHPEAQTSDDVLMQVHRAIKTFSLGQLNLIDIGKNQSDRIGKEANHYMKLRDQINDALGLRRFSKDKKGSKPGTSPKPQGRALPPPSPDRKIGKGF